MVFGFFRKKKEKKRRAAAMQFVHGTLQIPMTLAGLTGEKILSDRWAMGYIFGFHDGLLQAMKLTDEVEGMAFMAVSYDTLFPKVGPELFRKSLDLQRDARFHEGMVAGGTEVTEFMRHETPPMGLATHDFK